MPFDAGLRADRVLVLGSGGRLGTILRRAWPSDGRVTWQSRQGSEGALTLDPLADAAGLRDVARGCRTILCLAGARDGDLAANTDLALAAVAAARPGSRVILASSAAVYGRQDGVLREDSALRPVSAYGEAKARMEDRARALGDRLGVFVTALRVGNVAGADAILGGWGPGYALDILPDGRTPRRSYIGPRGFARVLRALLARPDLPGVLNLALPGPVETGALLAAAGRVWTPRPADAGCIASVHLGTERLSRLLRQPLWHATPRDLVRDWRAVQQ